MATDTSDKKKPPKPKKPGKQAPYVAPQGHVKGIGPKGQYLGGLQPGVIGPPMLSNPSMMSVILRGKNSKRK